jgi:hypothetical protein
MLVAVASLGFASVASAAPLATVSDPTPNGQFSGTYQCGWEHYTDAQGQEQYTLDANGNRKPVYCNQTGYVSVGPEGVVACNGNQNLKRPDDGSALQGYVWVGPSLAAKYPSAAAPGGAAGAGHNNETPGNTPTSSSQSPCP